MVTSTEEDERCDQRLAMQRAALRKCRRLLGAHARALIERAALGGGTGVPMKAGKGVSVSLCAAQLSWRSRCRRRDDKTPLGCRRDGMSNVRTAALVYGARAVGYGVAVAVDVAVDVAVAVVVAVAVGRGRLTLSRPSNLKERGEDPGRGNLLSNALHGVLYTKVKVSHTGRLSKLQRAL